MNQINVVKQIQLAFKTQFKAISFIFKHNLWTFYFFPILVSILLFVLGFNLGSSLSDWIQESIQQWLGLDHATDDYGWLKTAIHWTVMVIVKVVLFFIIAYINGYLVVVLLSPVFSILSEKVEKKVTGKSYPFSIRQFFKDILRGIILATRNFFYEMALTVVILLCSFIPIVNGLVTPLLLFVGAYFYGFSFLDYALERRHLNRKQSIQYVRRHKVLATTLALPFTFILGIPFIGALFAGFLAINTNTAATLSILEIEQKSTPLDSPPILKSV